MKKVSILKKIKLYLNYRKVILSNKEDFKNNYNIRIDNVNRMYTVVNVPNQLFDEPYNMRTADINRISEPYITEYIRQVSMYLNKIGLSELYKMYDIQKVDKYSYLIVIGFSLFNTSKIARNIVLKFLPTLILMLIIFSIYKTFK